MSQPAPISPEAMPNIKPEAAEKIIPKEPTPEEHAQQLANKRGAVEAQIAHTGKTIATETTELKDIRGKLGSTATEAPSVEADNRRLEGLTDRLTDIDKEIGGLDLKRENVEQKTEAPKELAGAVAATDNANETITEMTELLKKEGLDATTPDAQEIIKETLARSQDSSKWPMPNKIDADATKKEAPIDLKAIKDFIKSQLFELNIKNLFSKLEALSGEALEGVISNGLGPDQAKMSFGTLGEVSPEFLSQLATMFKEESKDPKDVANKIPKLAEEFERVLDEQAEVISNKLKPNIDKEPPMDNLFDNNKGPDNEPAPTPNLKLNTPPPPNPPASIGMKI